MDMKMIQEAKAKLHRALALIAAFERNQEANIEDLDEAQREAGLAATLIADSNETQR